MGTTALVASILEDGHVPHHDRRTPAQNFGEFRSTPEVFDEHTNRRDPPNPR